MFIMFVKYCVKLYNPNKNYSHYFLFSFSFSKHLLTKRNYNIFAFVPQETCGLISKNNTITNTF